MDPDDRELLLRTAKLAEDNNRRLRRVERSLFWGRVWDIIKIAAIVIPFVVGYFYLEPYLGSFGTSIDQVKQLINGK